MHLRDLLRDRSFCDVDFCTVGDVLQGLQGPDRQPLIRVDAAGDAGEVESCHGAAIGGAS